MSYGSPSRCAAEWVQIYFAVAKGIIPVAAAGNEFEKGNPLEFPASLPHVVTVAATTPDDKSAVFSNANDAIDLSAPGVDIMTAVPRSLDEDGAPGRLHSAMSGTSFSAPMVSAAIAWVRAARPELTPDRVVQAVRLTARDVLQEGWDALTGFGVLDVGAALSVPEDKLPIQDPLEPNDNLVWVNGRAFGAPAAPLWSGGKATRISGLLDEQEDPVDAYRIVIPGGRTAKISVIPRFGDPSLEVFHSSAISVNDEESRVALSRPAGLEEDRDASPCATPGPRSAPTTWRSARRATRAIRSASTPCASAERLVRVGARCRAPSWSPWPYCSLVAAPARAGRTLAVDADGGVHAFVVGSDGALYHAARRARTLTRVGGSLAQEPVAAARRRRRTARRLRPRDSTTRCTSTIAVRQRLVVRMGTARHAARGPARRARQPATAGSRSSRAGPGNVIHHAWELMPGGAWWGWSPLCDVRLRRRPGRHP